MQKPVHFLSNSGSTILLAVVFGAVFALMAAGTMTIATHGLTSGERDIEIMKAYWANESALNVGSEVVLQTSNLPGVGPQPLFTVPGGVPVPLRVNNLSPSAQISTTGNPTEFAFVASTVLPSGGTALTNAVLGFAFPLTPLSLTGVGWSTMVQ